MKRHYPILILGIALAFTSSASAGQESKPTTTDPTSAVSEFNKDEGFKMTDVALNSMGVTFSTLTQGSTWSIPQEALVRVKHSTGVYRRYEGWISLVLVKVATHEKGQYRITSDDLQAGDEIAMRGTQFLRMTELDLNSDTVDTCSH